MDLLLKVCQDITSSNYSNGLNPKPAYSLNLSMEYLLNLKLFTLFICNELNENVFR